MFFLFHKFSLSTCNGAECEFLKIVFFENLNNSVCAPYWTDVFYPDWKINCYPYRFIWSVPFRENERSIHGISESWRRLVAMYRYYTETDTADTRLRVIPLCTIPPCCFSYVFCQSISTQDSILERRLWCKITKFKGIVHSWNLI